MSTIPEKPPAIFDRDAEWTALADRWGRDTPDLVFVVGRRRVGKSFLLARFAQAVGGLYYQATRRTEAEQLASLSRAVGDHFGDPALQRGVGFPDWAALFDYVADRAGRERFLLVLDEFPYLAEAAPALPSVIQAAWDHRWAESAITLVLSGSYITAMEALEGPDQPLFGRRTARLAIQPFQARDAAAFVPGYESRDQLLAYGLFGHLPGHLALLDPDRPLAENAAALLLDPSSRLSDDAQHFLDAYLGEAAVHYSIVQAVAGGARTWSELTKRVGRSGGALLRPLQWLEGMGLVERAVPIDERDPAKSKRAVYRVTDPYVQFWHREVAPLVRTGSVGLAPPDVLWSEAVAPRVDDHMGDVFEGVCRDWVGSEAAAGTLPFRPLRVGSWWNAASTLEADVVALGSGGRVLVGEAKWGALKGAHLTRLRTVADAVVRAVQASEPPMLALFTGRSDADEAVREAEAQGEVLVVTSKDLLA